MAFNIEYTDLENEEILANKIMDLCSIVFRRHFYANEDDKDDLISVGILKSYSLIREGRFNNEKGKILNFLYTGIRNEMHNYIYHNSKEICKNEIEGEEQGYYDQKCFEIESSLVTEVCKEFYMYGNLTYLVCEELEVRGFLINKKRVGSASDMIRNEFVDDVIDRLCGAVLWKRQEYSH